MRQHNGRSFGRRLVSRAASVTFGVAVAALLASCSAGQITQTATQDAAVNGDGASVGALRISNATLAYPDDEQDYWPNGSDVPLTMSIANKSGQSDTLSSVTSSLTDDVAIEGDTTIRPHKALTVDGGTAEVAGEAAAETGGGEVGTATVTLRGIGQDLFPGQVVTVTLTFDKAGTVELRVPIEAPDEPRTDEHESGSGSGH